MLRGDGSEHFAKGFIKRRAGKLGGEIHAGLELLLAELFRHLAPRHRGLGGGEIFHLQREAVQILIERKERRDAARAGRTLRIRVKAERIAAALDLDARAGLAEHLVTARGGGLAAEIDGDLADVAVHAEGLEEGVGHDEMAVGSGMETILAAHIIALAERGLGLGHRVDHRAVDIRVGLAEFRGELAADAAELGETVVVAVGGFAGREARARREVFRVHRAGAADDDVLHARGRELLDHRAHVVLVALPHGLVERPVAAVVHAVARRGDRRLKRGEIILQPPGKTARRLAAPAELEDPDVRPPGAGDQIGLHEFAVQLLLGDRVADDGDAGIGRQRIGRVEGGGGRGEEAREQRAGEQRKTKHFGHGRRSIANRGLYSTRPGNWRHEGRGGA